MAAAAAIGAACAAALALAPARAAAFEYLYVEPNSGSSSGGHVALRLGDSTYHFQHHAGGVIRLHRAASDAFEWSYRALENRSMRMLRVALSDGGEERVRDAFEDELFRESRAFDRFDSLAADADFLDGSRLPEKLGIPGAAYFAWGDAAGEPPALAELRARVDARFGAVHLAQRAAAVRDEIEALRPDAEELGTAASQPDRALRTQETASLQTASLSIAFPAAPSGGLRSLAAAPGDSAPGNGVRFVGLVDRYRDLAAGWTAIDLLLHPRSLDQARVVESGASLAALDDSERRRLGDWRARLIETLPQLLESRRSDWGVPLLIGMARLLAIDSSLASGRLRTLDVFSSDDPLLPAAAIRRQSAALDAIVRERRADLSDARARFARADSLVESDVSRLELTASFEAEAARARDLGTAIRRPPEVPLPMRAAWPPELPVPRIAEGERAALAAATATERDESATSLAHEFHYDLVTRNCATELLRLIDGAMGGNGTAPPAALDPDQRGNFVPYRSADSIATSLPVVEDTVLPSFREYHLARLANDESGWVEALTESNVLTSRIYRHGRGDEPFLFFTTGAWPARPVLGAVNVAVGVAATAAGVLTSPFDGGRLVTGGLDGVLFSIPELVFVNVRKGSYELLPRDWQSWNG